MILTSQTSIFDSYVETKGILQETSPKRGTGRTSGGALAASNCKGSFQ